MPRRKPAPPASGHLRRSIAAAAARLMAEDGIADHAVAKRKAARQLGAADSEALPSNDEVDAELLNYQELFHGEEYHQRLLHLRRQALEVMKLLTEFRPCLTGAVLEGTAGRYTAIELDLFADSSKDVEIFLLSRDIEYRVHEMPRKGPHSPETRLNLEWEDCDVELNIYPPDAEREIPRGAHSGRSRVRARASAVIALLAEAA